MVTGESSPFYLTNHHAPGRIKTTLPDAKLLVTLRNPVDRAYSYYHMSVRQHRQSMTFEDAVRHGYTAQAGHADLYRGRYAEHMGDHRRRLREQTAGYLSRGHYAEHLTRWFEHFDRDRFLILTLDELKADPRGGGAIARVFEFLGLDPFDVKPQDRGPQDPAVKYGRMAKDGNAHNVGTYPKMNPDTRKTPVDYYRPHNRRLSVLLKRDFDWDR